MLESFMMIQDHLNDVWDRQVPYEYDDTNFIVMEGAFQIRNYYGTIDGIPYLPDEMYDQR